MALMGVIIHAVGSICSSTALECPVGFEELLEGHMSRPLCLNQTNYVPLFSQQLQACVITFAFSVNKSECCFAHDDGV